MRKSLSFSFWSKRCSIRLHLRFAQRSSHIARRGVKLACKPKVQISSPQVNTSTLRQPLRLSVLFRRCGWCELHSAKQNGVLPLGVAFVIITLIVLIAITFSSLGKIPQAVCAFQTKPSESLFSSGKCRNIAHRAIPPHFDLRHPHPPQAVPLPLSWGRLVPHNGIYKKPPPRPI